MKQKFVDWFESVDDAKLSVAEFRVLMFLGIQQAARQEPFSMSISIIASRCRINPKTASKAIDSLKKKHFISVIAVDGQPSLYSLLVDYSESYKNHAVSCVYCGAITNLTMDHVVPKNLGGTDLLKNLVHACQKCNSGKGARTPEEWRAK